MSDRASLKTSLAPAVAPAVPRATNYACFLVDHLEHTRVVRLVEGEHFVVGRDPDVEVSIEGDTSVSRRHARFELRAGTVSVLDLDSTNGTRLNGTSVREAAVRVGDQVELGNVTITIFAPAPLRTSRTGELTHDQFIAALEEEVERARYFRRTAAVAMVTKAGDALRAAELVRPHLRPVDRLGLYSEGMLEVLLPELGAEQALALLATAGLDGGTAAFPADGASAEALLSAAREASKARAPRPAARATPPPLGRDLLILSPVMRELFDTVERLAHSSIPVLLHGETGTGKEMLARAIHERGPRGRARLVALNCGAIPPTLLEDVLFGHERGAFTGATAASAGIFEEADGGTVLLDEVGELSPAAQAALLRVLETNTVRRVGSSREAPVDIRLLAATHRDLEAMVRAGTFREDLLYRLDAMTLEVPPLRERPEEILPLAERFLAQANAANGRHLQGLLPEATRALLRYAWPGNIRELRNAMEHAVVVAKGTHIDAVDLPKRTREFVATLLRAPDETPDAPLERDLKERVQRYETHVILEALRAAGGNRTEAARRLQVPVRTLSHKLRHHGIKKLGFGVDDSDDAP